MLQGCITSVHAWHHAGSTAANASARKCLQQLRVDANETAHRNARTRVAGKGVQTDVILGSCSKQGSMPQLGR
jgi:hypothetical protein